MRKVITCLVLVLCLTVPAQSLAHEGHEHHVMGVVTAVDASHMEIDTKDGKKATILLDKETKYFHGKISATVGDIKVGDRIVATVVEAGAKLKAREVRLATEHTEAPVQPSTHPHHP